jgi:hypothetical protein
MVELLYGMYICVETLGIVSCLMVYTKIYGNSCTASTKKIKIRRQSYPVENRVPTVGGPDQFCIGLVLPISKSR